MKTPQRDLYVLMPFQPDLDRVREVLRDVAAVAGYRFVRADEDAHDVDIVRKIIDGIQKATVVIADLTYCNPNVLYELGVANALSKDCLMICQKSGTTARRGSWVVSTGDAGDLPFDLGRFAVVPYVNTLDGIAQLKSDLLRTLDATSDEPISSPVNVALEARLKQARTTAYFLWGAGAGYLIGLPASLLAAAFGTSLAWDYHEGYRTLRILFEGAIAGFFMGAPALGAFAIIYNRRSADLRRLLLCLLEVLAGLVGGFLIASTLMILDAGKFGVSTALSYASGYFLIPAIGGLGLGLTFNIQPPRAVPEVLGLQLLKSTLALMACSAAAVVVLHALRWQLFNLTYLGKYELIDAVSDAARYCVWGILMSATQWWLKWKRRL